MTMKSLARFVLLAAAAAAVPAFAAAPVPKIGSVAPALDLPAADGSRRSLAAIDGPRVLIFYRGLW
jgi:hypothetical protein